MIQHIFEKKNYWANKTSLPYFGKAFLYTKINQNKRHCISRRTRLIQTIIILVNILKIINTDQVGTDVDLFWDGASRRLRNKSKVIMPKDLLLITLEDCD